MIWKSFKHGFCFCVVVTVMLVARASVRGEPWTDIVPLHSQRYDVAQIVKGEVVTDRLDFIQFRQYRRMIRVSFTVGKPCSESNKLWNVPEGTVNGISITYTTDSILLQNASYDLKSFNLVKDPEIIGHIDYVNKKRGINISALGLYLRGADFTQL